MRGTTHNGRTGKNGTYSPKHNDRNFDVDKAEHIDQSRVDKNWYWHRYKQDAPEMTFEQAERKFYEENFIISLTAKNERYRASGHKERMKTMDEYRENRLSCPEETLLQVGKVGETIDADLLKQICIEHINWEIQTFKNVKLLDVALHVDEEGAPHIHERKVWVAQSKDGLIVGQAKALAEMGIESPHPEKKKDRYNNPKTTYTAMCREHFLQVCKEYGLDLELEPEKTSKRGLELDAYKTHQEKAEQARLEAEKEALEADIQTLKRRKGKLQDEIDKKLTDASVKASETIEEAKSVSEKILDKARQQAWNVLREERTRLEEWQAEKEREFQVRDEEWRKQVEDLANQIDKEIDRVYQQRYHKELQQYEEITDRKRYKDYQRVIEEMAYSNMKYKGKPILEVFKERAQVDFDSPILAPPVLDIPKVRNIRMPKIDTKTIDKAGDFEY